MARYSLILRDEIYLKAVQVAQKKQMSLGKLFNKAIEEYINRELGIDPVQEILKDPLFHELFSELKKKAIKHFGEVPKHILDTWYNIYREKGRNVSYDDFREAVELLGQ